MDLATKLELFLDIVQQGTFAKVADIRNLDRSVISKQIKALETQLGVRLLNRSTRSISLTDAGHEIAKQAEIVRNALVETQRLANSFHSEPKGLIRISSYTSFGHLYLKKAINDFMIKYPETYVDLILDDKREDLISGKFDIAFRIGPPKDSTMIAKKLALNKLAILASKGFIQQYGEPNSVDELIKLPAIIYSNGEFHFDKLEISDHPQSDEITKQSMKGRLKANDMATLISAVEAGLGYSIIPLSALKENIQEKGLIPLLTDHQLPNIHGEIYAVYPHRNKTPLINLLIETVQQTIKTPPVWEGYIDNYSSLYK
ncbi:LysR family transcriptional regulator [Psychromonas marina]|uniref:LysR family transcriptional regulator n=1 Tax=Psychromonas marina TaxID=88364 RepID=A0ABQ6E008_9GAMM|nr:LysR family transcriptional regulator [Psychromonas marina]GLS90346.1 LysR family transcriptional regulator [Psychromonas marina]